jgi:preprotein translocase subunit YajC
MGTQVAVAPRSGTPANSPNPLVSFMPVLVIGAIFYFLLIRPQQRQAREHKALVDNLKTGDKVLTQGGIYGTVSALKGAIVQVKIAENVRVDVSRSAITNIEAETPSGKVVTPEVVS